MRVACRGRIYTRGAGQVPWYDVSKDDSGARSPNDAGPSTVQSVDRAIWILEILSRDGEASVSEIARELGVHASTASRLISSLAEHDLVERPDGNGRARLGIGLLRLAGATASQLDLAEQAQPVCDALAAQLGETVNVAVLSGNVAVNVCQAQSTSSVSSQNWVGRRTVLHATSSGKILLAYLNARDTNALLRDGMERFTERTVTSPRVLRMQLRKIREAGYARVVEEYEEGLAAVAAPVRSYNGDVIAAISVAGPTYRMSPDDLSESTEAVIKSAADLSQRMGFIA